MQRIGPTADAGKGNRRLRIQENPSAAGAPPRTLLRELTALLQTPSWWGGAGCPLSKNPIPALGPSGLASPTPYSKISSDAVAHAYSQR